MAISDTYGETYLYSPDSDETWFVTIRKPVVAMHPVLGIAESTRYSSDGVFYSRNRKEAEGFTIPNFVLPHGWQGVEYLVGEIVKDDVEDDLWYLAEVHGDPMAVVQELWDALSPEEQSLWEESAKSYNPDCDDHVRNAQDYMMEYGADGDGVLLWTRAAEAALLRAGYMVVPPCMEWSNHTGMALVYVGGDK